MQSFLTILVAGAAAFMAMVMMPPSEPRQDATFVSASETVTLADSEVPPSIVISEARPLVLALDYNPTFEAGFDLTVDGLSAFQE
ncbi:MAG: hypothetical protein AAFO74_05765 [Pseudomonadota bacterium]